MRKQNNGKNSAATSNLVCYLKKYCINHNLKVHTLNYWIKKFNKESDPIENSSRSLNSSFIPFSSKNNFSILLFSEVVEPPEVA
jgi:hypothetical protein